MTTSAQVTRTGAARGSTAEYVDGLPGLCGQEQLIAEAIAAGRARPVAQGEPDIASASATFAVALHMYQPLIPTGGDGDLRSAGIISILEQLPGHGLFPAFERTLQAAARG
jgi:hypothetical protein